MSIKLVRSGVFETNSSSCHSISLSFSGTFEGVTPDEDGVIYLTPGEFGWEKETYTDPKTKMSYAWQDQCQHDHKKLAMFKKVVMEHTGASDVIMVASDDKYYEFGYIDHQSCGTAYDAFENEWALKNFLFNPNSELVTDNDND